LSADPNTGIPQGRVLRVGREPPGLSRDSDLLREPDGVVRPRPRGPAKERRLGVASSASGHVRTREFSTRRRHTLECPAQAPIRDQLWIRTAGVKNASSYLRARAEPSPGAACFRSSRSFLMVEAETGEHRHDNGTLRLPAGPPERDLCVFVSERLAGWTSAWTAMTLPTSRMWWSTSPN
jgi:hypothetical protein